MSVQGQGMAESTALTRASAALIVGGGLSGMQTALLLAQKGHRVYLLDTAPGIGGSLHLLDRTFPTDSCGLCISSPTNATYCPSLECSLHPNILPMPLTELLAVDGEPGRFRATLRRNPRYVNIDRCNLCGDCAEVCPAARPLPYEGGLAPQKAIYAPPPRAVPNAYVIDMAACTRCGKCVEVCQTQAINLEEQGTEEVLEVGAVILSPGYAPFDARRKGEFGFGFLSNVVTSLQFERMTSPPGSTGGRLVRPSDGTLPKRIAFIQCVGSRDQTVGREYCSSVCCMYTAKQARAALDIQLGVQVVVFTMDIRTFGKGYDRYWDSVEARQGIQFRRAMVSNVKQHPKTGELTLNYTAENGLPAEESFDLLVLSVGFDAPESARELARRLSVNVNDYGFAQANEWEPVNGSRPGILVAGCYQEPKDIPDTIAEAAAAAAQASRFLGRPTPPERKSVPAELSLRDEEIKTGVYVCTCWDTLGNILDMTTLQAHAQTLPHVAAVKTVQTGCGGRDIADLTVWINETGVNRVVFAGCSPRLYQPDLENALAQAGLNPALLQRANIREGCAWVHRDEPEAANDKARELVAMAAARAVYAAPVRQEFSEVRDAVLVIGGGLAGMTTALTLADMGHAVALVERDQSLGGQLPNVGFTPETPDTAQHASTLAQQVQNHPLITVHLGASVQSLPGVGGDFHADIQTATGETTRFNCGAVIVATGGREAKVTEYLYGSDPRVILQGDLSRVLAHGLNGMAGSPLGAAKSVVMIQCAGSRDENRPYCSRICCTQAVKNAIRLKELHPETDAFILYRDVRTFGFKELLYRQARDLGVIFVRYDLPDKPEVTASTGGLTVAVLDQTLRQPVEIRADAVILSTGVVPNDNGELAQVLGVPLDSDGFFQEQHTKMRPMNFMKPGIFLCGLAHAPHFISETIAQAKGAAMRVSAYLAQRPRLSKPTRVRVNKRLCSFCGLCVSACPYEARVMDYDERVAQVLTGLCQGCGICAITCPNKATQQEGFEHKSILAELDAAVLGL